MGDGRPHTVSLHHLLGVYLAAFPHPEGTGSPVPFLLPSQRLDSFMTFNTFEDLCRSDLDPGEIAALAVLGELDHLIDRDSLEIIWDEYGPFVAFSPRRPAKPTVKPLSDAERVETLRCD